MKAKIKASFVLLLSLLSTAIHTEDEILQMIVLFRNGSRFPQFGDILRDNTSPEFKTILDNLNFPKGTSLDQINQTIRNQLTGNGMRQMYRLGKAMKEDEKYKEFLEKQIKSNEDVKVLASNKQKTVNSANIFMYGLLGEELQAGQKFEAADLNTFYHKPRMDKMTAKDSELTTVLPHGNYSFPVYSVNYEKNRIFLAYESQTCKGFDYFGANLVQLNDTYLDSIQKTINSNADLQRILTDLAKYRGFYDKNTKDYSKYIKDPIVLYLFTDYVEAMREVGVDYVKTDTPEDMKKWVRLLKISDYYKSLYFFEQKAMTVQLTYLLRNMRKQIKKMFDAKKIPYHYGPNEKEDTTVTSNDEEGDDQLQSPANDTEEAYPKLLVYSGHDVNLWAMFNNFGMTCSECLNKKIDNEDMDLDDLTCLGNTDFATNLVFLLKRPVGVGVQDDEPTNNVYVGKWLFSADCLRGLPE